MAVIIMKRIVGVSFKHQTRACHFAVLGVLV